MQGIKLKPLKTKEANSHLRFQIQHNEVGCPFFVYCFSFFVYAKTIKLKNKISKNLQTV